MASTPQGGDPPATDGRTQRSERSREAIVQALIELVGAGELEPTAQQVADRAKVGIRTVFRHFSDMELLFASMNEKITALVQPLLLETRSTGDIAERVRSLVAARAALFERIAPFKRSAALRRARSPFITKQRQVLRRELRADLLRTLPELLEAAPERQAALEAATSFEVWDHYRSDQRLSAARSQAAMEHAALTLTS